MFDHIFNATLDPHTQYIKVDGTRGFTGVPAIAGTPVAVGTAIAPGSALTLARSDHVHGLGPLVVPTGAIQDLAVTTAKIADGAIINSKLGPGSVSGSKLAGSSVSSANIVDGTIQTYDMDSMALAKAMVVDLTLAATSGTTRRVLGTLNIPVQGYPYHLLVGAMYCGNNSVANDTYLMDILINDGTSTYGAGSVTIKHGGIGQDQAYVIPPTYVAPSTLSYALTITVGITRQTGTGILNFSAGGPWRMTALILPQQS
jgi:hypothetical protein